jgi:UPF0755 protein
MDKAARRPDGQMAGSPVRAASRLPSCRPALLPSLRALLPVVAGSLLACGAPSTPGSQEVVTIPAGASVRAIADSLAAHDIIGSPFWFRVLTRVKGKERQLQRGTYALARGAGVGSALAALASGQAILQRLTVPEGFTLRDIAELVERTLGIPRDRFLAAAQDSALLREFGIPGTSFEGYLRPETYLVAQGVDARKVLRVMAAAFATSWKPGWDSLAAAQELDRRSVVILASIVETEAKVDGDRPLIAAVYRNRIRLGMPLQADATVQYAMQLATGLRKPRLYEKDYDFPSPYNTYLHPGLPPGPVGAPGTSSIEAVLAPANVPFLYYVARPDGSHQFSRTYAEHLRAIRTIRSRERQTGVR